MNPVIGDWAFRSDPKDVEDVWGWIPISDSTEITKMPLHDTGKNLFARLGARLASKRLAELGAQLPTLAEYDALHALAPQIEPYVLPTDEPHLILDAGVALHDQEQIERFRETHMMSLAWCLLHDEKCMDRIARVGLGAPIANAGKHWAQPRAGIDRPGHALIYGWWTARARLYGVHNDTMIQEPSDFHDSEYVDYATTFHAVRARQ